MYTDPNKNRWSSGNQNLDCLFCVNLTHQMLRNWKVLSLSKIRSKPRYEATSAKLKLIKNKIVSPSYVGLQRESCMGDSNSIKARLENVNISILLNTYGHISKKSRQVQNENVLTKKSKK